MMNHRYLEVTYRNGKPLAAYLYLSRNPGDASVGTVKKGGGLLIDFASDGRAIGIEITAPSCVSLGSFNQALATVNQDLATADELSPLAAA